MMLLISTQKNEISQQQLRQMRYFIYSRIILDTQLNMQDLFKHLKQCPTVKSLDRVKNLLPCFKNKTCHFQTYVKSAQKLIDIFVAWNNDQRLCPNCQQFFKQRGKTIKMFMKNLLLLPQVPMNNLRDLIQDNSEHLEHIFLEMEQQGVCAYATKKSKLKKVENVAVENEKQKYLINQEVVDLRDQIKKEEIVELDNDLMEVEGAECDTMKKEALNDEIKQKGNDAVEE